MTQLKRVNVINYDTGVAYRTTHVGAIIMIRKQGFHFTTKAKLYSLLRDRNKEAKQKRRLDLAVKARKNNTSFRNRRPFKYRIKDMVKEKFNQN